jgi:hypothetical protein
MKAAKMSFGKEIRPCPESERKKGRWSGGEFTADSNKAQFFVVITTS